MGDEVMGASSSKPVTGREIGLLLLILEKREDEALVCSGDDSGVVVDGWRYSSEMKRI